MSFSTQSLPLEVWYRLHARVLVDYQRRVERLTAALTPVSVNIDTGAAAIQNAASERQEITALIDSLQQLQLLSMAVTNQLRQAASQTQIPSLELRIQCLRTVASLLETSLSNLPSRSRAEHELQHLITQHASLKNAGHGESVTAERQRMRAYTCALPTLGAEDATRYETEARSLHADIDRLEAELQGLRVGTLVMMRVPENVAEQLASFGVQLTRDEEPVAEAEASATAAQ